MPLSHETLEAFIARDVYPIGDPLYPCEGSKFHSPRPTSVHAVYLSDVLGEVRGEIEPTKRLNDPTWLCRNCHENLLNLTLLMDAYDGVVPWEAKREFGNTIRAFADRIWAAEEVTVNG